MTKPDQLLYFENAAGRLVEHPDRYVRFEYLPGKRALPNFQALHTHQDLLLRRNQWNKVLSDQRLMAPFTPEESAWLVDFELENSRQRAGDVHRAVLIANDVIARLSMSQVLNDAKAAALTYRVFADEAAAVAWLKQIK